MTDVDVKNALLVGPPEKGETRVIPSYAGDLTVRGVSRGEVFRLKGLKADGKINQQQFEAHLVAAGMVSPVMTPEEVAAWQEADLAAGVLGDVSDAISELSGLSQGAQKSRVSRARKRS